VVKHATELLQLLNDVDTWGSAGSAAGPAPTHAEVRAAPGPFTFTPDTSSATAALLAKPARTPQPRTASDAYLLATSPAAALDIDELYRSTGWLTPVPFVETSQHQVAAAGNWTAGKIREIKQELSAQPFRALMETASFDRVPGDEAGEEFKVDATEARSSSGDEDAEDGDSSDFAGVPRSMAEIFQISNNNRTKNKEKKKMREAQHPLMDGSAEATTAEPEVGLIRAATSISMFFFDLLF
jgi:hypothetical protein